MRLIDADKLKDIISDTWILDRINEQPTVDAEPVRHAHWTVVKYPLIICSECGAMYHNQDYKFDYCPNCGTKMDEEVEE